MIRLSHTAVNMTSTHKVFENVNGVDEMIRAIAKTAQRVTKNEEDCNKFCGEAFEVFVEFFMNATAYDNRIGVANYKQYLLKDLGVDGVGVGSDGNPAVVQAKFRKNWSDVLHYKELATFGNDALSRFHIVSVGAAEAQKEILRKKNIPEAVLTEIKSTMHNVFLITTARDVSHHWNTVNAGARFIGYNELKELTDRMPNFWFDLRDSINESRPRSKERIVLERFSHQRRMNDAVDLFFRDKNQSRGQVICATGGGKTLVQVDAAENVIKNHNGKVIVILSPRISLTRQHIKEFDKNQPKGMSFNLQCICSGDDVIPEGYSDSNPFFGKIEPTGDIEKIKEWVDCATNDKPLVICCTYHSAKKIRQACIDRGNQVDLVICDEAHNMTAKNFNLIPDEKSDSYIPAKKWLFFTATRKTDYSGDGRGMNNNKLFGKIILKVLPKELIDAGVILPPRIRVCHYNPNMYIDENSEDELRINIAMIVVGITEHEKFYQSESRVIISCGNACTEPKGYMNSKIVQQHFSHYYMAAITSEYCIEKNVGETHFTSADRDSVFKKFAEHSHSLMFHYDVVGEGIDFPGVTGLLPLRSLGNIKTVQSIGRTLRLDVNDRLAIQKGTLSVNDRSMWNKPYGEFILPVVYGHNTDDALRMYDIIKSLMNEGFTVDLETFTNVPEIAKSASMPKSDNLEAQNEERKEVPQFTMNCIEQIRSKVKSEIMPWAKKVNEQRYFYKPKISEILY